MKFPELGTKTLQVNRFQAWGVPGDMDVEFITQNLEITVRGPKGLVEALTANDVTVSVDFSNAEPGTVKLKAEVTFDAEYEDVGVLGNPMVTAILRDG